MLSKSMYLALRLQGPLQSWGFDSQYNRRNTGLMPTKSAIAGMCCAAIGLSRGSDKEKEFLASFRAVRMTAIAIPRALAGKELPVRRLQDYHTVGGGYDPNNPNERGSITVKAESGAPRAKNGQALAVLTRRQYLNDASFGILLQGEDVILKSLAIKLNNPVWGIWLGRKTCIPSAPIFAGLKDSIQEALHLLIGDNSIELFTRQEEVENFAEGHDSLPDTALSFAIEERLFSARRVRMIKGKKT